MNGVDLPLFYYSTPVEQTQSFYVSLFAQTIQRPFRFSPLITQKRPPPLPEISASHPITANAHSFYLVSYKAKARRARSLFRSASHSKVFLCSLHDFSYKAKPGSLLQKASRPFPAFTAQKSELPAGAARCPAPRRDETRCACTCASCPCRRARRPPYSSPRPAGSAKTRASRRPQ